MPAIRPSTPVRPSAAMPKKDLFALHSGLSYAGQTQSAIEWFLKGQSCPRSVGITASFTSGENSCGVSQGRIKYATSHQAAIQPARPTYSTRSTSATKRQGGVSDFSTLLFGQLEGKEAFSSRVPKFFDWSIAYDEKQNYCACQLVPTASVSPACAGQHNQVDDGQALTARARDLALSAHIRLEKVEGRNSRLAQAKPTNPYCEANLLP